VALPRRRLVLTAAAIPVWLLLSTGCRSAGPRGPEGPSTEAPPSAAEACPPLRVDGSTARYWGEALASFVQERRLSDACVLVRTGECLQDPPPSALDRLREGYPLASAWSFRCGPGVTILTLRDEQTPHGRFVSIGDGFSATCTWKLRKRWTPWQGRLESLGCVAAEQPGSRGAPEPRGSVR